jgi:transcriptional regulator of arginine metabolism
MAKQNTISRLQAIKELIEKQAVSDQKHLVELLALHYGIASNQAAVSRDLRKLGVTKKCIHGALVYETPKSDVTREILKLALIDIAHNETTIVIKTHAGLAAFVGDVLDRQTDLGILGCLAGENVVFAIPKTMKEIGKVCEELCQRLYFKKANHD